MWQIHAILFIAKFQEEVLGKKNLFLWGGVEGLYTFRDEMFVGPWKVKCVALKECWVNPGMVKIAKDGVPIWVHHKNLSESFGAFLLKEVAETAMKKKRRDLKLAA